MQRSGAKPLDPPLALSVPGAMGNGLRVVTGCVFASGGTIRVLTHGQRLDLTSREDGGTDVQSILIAFSPGTRVEVVFGGSIPRDPDTLRAERWFDAKQRQGRTFANDQLE